MSSPSITIYTDRSRIETYQHCKRERFLSYHQEAHGQAIGIRPERKPLPLAVGGSVHAGLAYLLWFGEVLKNSPDAGEQWRWRNLEEEAVKIALSDFGTYRGSLEVDAGERMVMPVLGENYDEQLKAQALALGMDIEGLNLSELSYDPGNKLREFDDYLWREQSALVEALVRAYARRRLRPLLDEFIILEVEREDQWLLNPTYNIVFMSRPDALLLRRADLTLHIMSFKTAASWDRRKEKDALHDSQGLSEGVGVEMRLRKWWETVTIAYSSGHNNAVEALVWCDQNMSVAMRDYLSALPEPPRIHAIRYEYILKGERWKDTLMATKFGFEVRSQKSHLIRAYVCHSVPRTKAGPAPYAHGDICWAWEYHKEDGTESRLSWQNWRQELIVDQMPIVDWIDRLDTSTMTMSAEDPTAGLAPQPLGYSSTAQALGLTKDHPLDLPFVPPITVYRNDDDLRDWIEQTEAQEEAIARHVEEVLAAALEPGRLRGRLNYYFQQTRRACEYPSECVFVKICYGSDEIRRDPLASGKFVARIPHHTPELVSIQSAAPDVHSPHERTT